MNTLYTQIPLRKSCVALALKYSTEGAGIKYKRQMKKMLYITLCSHRASVYTEVVRHRFVVLFESFKVKTLYITHPM